MDNCVQLYNQSTNVRLGTVAFNTHNLTISSGDILYFIYFFIEHNSKGICVIRVVSIWANTTTLERQVVNASCVQKCGVDT